MNTTDTVTKKFDPNSSVTYSPLNGTWESENCIVTPSWYYDYLYTIQYPQYVLFHRNITETAFRNITETAFRVAKMLQEKKLINLKTVKQFVDLVDELIKVL